MKQIVISSRCKIHKSIRLYLKLPKATFIYAYQVDRICNLFMFLGRIFYKYMFTKYLHILQGSECWNIASKFFEVIEFQLKLNQYSLQQVLQFTCFEKTLNNFKTIFTCSKIKFKQLKVEIKIGIVYTFKLKYHKSHKRIILNIIVFVSFIFIIKKI